MSHTLSHTTVHSWFNASECNVLINTVYINHAHTRAHSHIQFIQKCTKIFTSALSDSRSQHCGQCVEMFEKTRRESKSLEVQAYEQ